MMPQRMEFGSTVDEDPNPVQWTDRPLRGWRRWRFHAGPRYGFWILTPWIGVSYWFPWSWKPLSVRQRRQHWWGVVRIDREAKP